MVIVSFDEIEVVFFPSVLRVDFCLTSSLQVENDKSLLSERDLEHICKLVEEKDGGPAWIQMMDRSTPRMSYQAWRRDPEVS